MRDKLLFKHAVRDWVDYWQSEPRLLAGEAAKVLAFDLAYALQQLSILERLNSSRKEEILKKAVVRWHFYHPMAWYESASSDLFRLLERADTAALQAEPPSPSKEHQDQLIQRASADPMDNFRCSLSYIFGNDLSDGSVSGPSLLEDWDAMIKDLSEYALTNGLSASEHSIPDTV